ncbi:hypothetical protein OE88DRAFT_276102 [Heliocybe sulcata]|uniref:Uncharacterized protein n=1 Tax=Heliocybe sulcata TaxID=5364 RepID=A0A5C3N0Q3_9AGAM|nr:hypothetical protein OE88DRAFT_276102 [Heliocybe sulcata]
MRGTQVRKKGANIRTILIRHFRIAWNCTHGGQSRCRIPRWRRNSTGCRVKCRIPLAAASSTMCLAGWSIDVPEADSRGL